MTDLLLRRVSESRAGSEGQDDYDVIDADGFVIGRIFRASTAPAGTPWMWTLAYGNHEVNHEDRMPTQGATSLASSAAVMDGAKAHSERGFPVAVNRHIPRVWFRAGASTEPPVPRR